MVPIGFDMEWPFTFTTGPGRTAVIQLCANVDLCYIFHVSELKKLPASLVILLTHDKVCLHGVNVKKYSRFLTCQSIIDPKSRLSHFISAIAGSLSAITPR